MYEYYGLRDVNIDDKNPDNEPGVFDFIQLAGDHQDLFISYTDVNQVIKLLRQGKRLIEKRYKQKQLIKGRLK
jgi:hypothetical protein